MVNFTLNVGLIYSFYVVILLTFKIFFRQSEKIDLPEKFVESFKIDKVILITLSILETFILFLIVFKNSLVLGFNFYIPFLFRLFGLGLGYFGLVFITLSLIKLKGRYSATLNIKKGHQLVQNGIYRYIRHPIYTGLFLLHLGVTLALANIFVAIVWIGGILIFLFHRVPKEEALLEYYFKEKYRDYKASTGLFLPKFYQRNKL
ncbi:MAG: methyltransferase family protein [Candidatus Kapaibacteriota bacterium]|jgi:protein-S-isoprenylcysteine O-methyltransferase Ste14